MWALAIGRAICGHSRALAIFFNDTATTEIYTLSLHDALPIWPARPARPGHAPRVPDAHPGRGGHACAGDADHAADLPARQLRPAVDRGGLDGAVLVLVQPAVQRAEPAADPDLLQPPAAVAADH